MVTNEERNLKTYYEKQLTNREVTGKVGSSSILTMESENTFLKKISIGEKEGKGTRPEENKSSENHKCLQQPL